MQKIVWVTSFIALLIISIAAYQTRSSEFLAKDTQPPLAKEVLSVEVEVPETVHTPKLFENSTYPEFTAQSVYVIDLKSNVSLYEKNIDLPLFPASLTKVITSLVALDGYNLDDVLMVKTNNIGGQVMHLAIGEEISVRDLLYGLLVYSANDAAEVLAQNYDGGRPQFIKAMNQKVGEYGLKSSRFTSPTGLDMSDQFTTSSDLVKVTKMALGNPFFREVVATKDIEVKSIDGAYSHKLTNINSLLGSVEGVMGVKTGWTESARENLITYVVRDDKEVLIVVLGSDDRFGETKTLIDWIFKNYNWE